MLILLRLQMEMNSSSDLTERDNKLIATLDNIRIERIFDIFTLFKLLESVSKEKNTLQLLMIDNLSSIIDPLPINAKKGSNSILLSGLLPQLQCLLKSLLKSVTIIITSSPEINNNAETQSTILHELFDFALQTRTSSNPLENDYETIIDIRKL